MNNKKLLLFFTMFSIRTRIFVARRKRNKALQLKGKLQNSSWKGKKDTKEEKEGIQNRNVILLTTIVSLSNTFH